MGKQSLAFVIVMLIGVLGLPGTPAGAQQAPPAPAQPAPPAPAQPAPAPPGQPAPGQPAPPGQPAQPAIPTVPQVPVAPPTTLTLGDALTTALRNNLQIRQTALGVTLARYQLREAEAQKSLTLGGSASFTTNSVSGGAPLAGTITIPGTEVIGLPFTATGLSGTATPSTLWNFALTLRYPLYTGGALESQIEIARANVVGSEAQFNAVAQQVVLSTRQAYYGVQQAQGSVEAAQRSVDAARENVRVTDARVRVGTSPQFDLLQAQVQLAQSEQALTRTTTALAQAQQSLAVVLFVPLGTTVAPATPLGLAQPPAEVEPLIRQALENRPEIAQVRASQTAARAAISLAESGLKPNVAVSGGPVISTTDPTNRDVVNFTASITLTLAILDGGLTEARVNQAKTRLQQAEVSEQQTRQQVELDVRNAFLTLRDAAEQLRFALAQQTAAREALRIANVRFQAGVGLQLEVVTAVQNLATADNNVVQAQFQYNVALALLDRAVGVQVKL